MQSSWKPLVSILHYDYVKLTNNLFYLIKCHVFGDILT